MQIAKTASFSSQDLYEQIQALGVHYIRAITARAYNMTFPSIIRLNIEVYLMFDQQTYV